MAYILIDFCGEKTFGGYLAIDGGKQIPLLDALLIPISEGLHHLSFSSKTNAQKRLQRQIL